jgi:GNAT superfamily N-acetyltransferase
MSVFREVLTLSPEDVSTRHAHVLDVGATTLGFYSLAEPASGAIELEHLFVDPEHLGTGIGRALFAHACQRARTLGADTLVIQSDPNAAGFYDAMGAQREREIQSSIPGRVIPLFRHTL